MKQQSKKLVFAMLLVILSMSTIPVLAQAVVPRISDEAQQEKERLLAKYEAALEFELSHGETAISSEDGSIILVGESAAKMDQLWQETVRQIEAAIARPAADRKPIENMIAAIDGARPAYIGRSGFPYNSSAATENYQTEKYFYTVDIASEQILEIMPVDSTRFRREAGDARVVYSQNVLEEMARTFIKTLAGDVDLQTLQPAFSDKNGRNYFFRWEDPASKLPDGMTSFVQVGLSVTGQLLNYVNTLPVATAQAQSLLERAGLFPFVALASFNETYANSGGYFFWENGGTAKDIVSNAGYCFIAGWCSPKNFFWGYTDATINPPQNEPYMKATWDVNPSSQYIYVKAFIPGTNATAYSRYTATYNNGANSQSVTIDQEIFSNVWASVLGPHFNYGTVKLDNNDDIAGYKVAWDEVLLCTSDQCP